MSWKDRLNLEGRGSFRGVEFFVGSVQSSIGRNKIVHEFPGRPNPKVVDDGGRPRGFQFRCFIVEEDYDFRRDVLREEFNKPGPGLLVHPYWGEFEVEVISEVRITEVDGEGGMARFDLTMIEVGVAPLIVAQRDLGPEVEVSANSALAAVAAAFSAAYSVANAITEVVQTAVNAINQVASQMRRARGLINSVLNVIDDIGTAITALTDAALALTQLPSQLASTIQGLTGDIFGAVEQIEELFGGGGGAPIGQSLSETASIFDPTFGDFKAEKVLESARLLTSPGEGVTSEDQVVLIGSDPDQDLGEGQGFEVILSSESTQTTIAENNQRAMDKLHRRTAAIESSRMLVRMNYSSRDFVLSTREETLENLDFLILEADDSEVWATLVDLRDVFSRRMDQIASDLPDISETTPQVTLPALVIAYNVHGDSAKNLEIIARNDIGDPNFVIGGRPLKVLIDG